MEGLLTIAIVLVPMVAIFIHEAVVTAQSKAAQRGYAANAVRYDEDLALTKRALIAGSDRFVWTDFSAKWGEHQRSAHDLATLLLAGEPLWLAMPGGANG